MFGFVDVLGDAAPRAPRRAHCASAGDGRPLLGHDGVRPGGGDLHGVDGLAPAARRHRGGDDWDEDDDDDDQLLWS